VLAVTVAIVLFGTYGYQNMGVAVMPNVNFPMVTVTTIYPGADPETVESKVTKPIEDAIAALPNIDHNGLTSTSSQGISSVVVQFNTAANPEMVSVDVERVVNGARSKLPPEAEPPTVMKIDLNAFGVMTVMLSGPQSLTALQELAEDRIQQQLGTLPGVSSATIQSGVVREIQVRVDQNRLQSSSLSINQVINALQSQQLEMPAGTITQGGRDYSIYFDALVTSPEQLGAVPVLATENGTVYLRDVATIQDTFQKRARIVRVNGREGIALVIAKLPQANTLSVAEQVKHAIERLDPTLPPDTHLSVVVDASLYTEKSFHTVQRALFEAVIFTGLILLLFLHTWRSTLIVLMSIPTSLLATLVAMGLLNYNLNLLTMMALTLSVGILVDDSIVVLENIYRHFDMGKPPFQAALDGRSEIGLAALTITLVDVVVYVPISVMLAGISAEFIRPFALTIAFATLASLAVSFTLTPLLASRLLRHSQASGGRSPLTRFGEAWDAGFAFVERQYAGLLRHALPKRWLVIMVGLASFVGGMYLPMSGKIGTDFFPTGDQSDIGITMTLPPGTALETTNRATLELERVLATRPEIHTVYSIVGQLSTGFGGDSGANSAQVQALLVPPTQRSQSNSEIGAQLRDELAATIPGAKIQVGYNNPFGWGAFGGQPIQIFVQGSDPATLDTFAADVLQTMREVPRATSVRSSNDDVQTQVRAKVDWQRAADLGVNPQSAALALRTAIDGYKSTSSQYRRTGRSSVDIRILSSNAGNATMEDIGALPVAAGNGTVRLDQFVTFQRQEIPTAIRHVMRLRSVTIGAEPSEGHLVGDAQQAVITAIDRLPVPSGAAVTYAGQGQQGSDAFTGIIRAMQVAILLMYMLMMVLFGSLTLPLAVLMSLPLAAVGALGAMALTRTPFTLFSLLGLAVLLGLVGKNAILLVDYTEILRQRGADRTTALLQAGPTRLRPIVMTTVSIIAALLPIASGLEEGSELLKSAAVVLIGGLLTSTLLTLVFVPAMYTIFDDMQSWVLRRFHGKPRPTAPQPATEPHVQPARGLAVSGGSGDDATIVDGVARPPAESAKVQ
jgi:HAE1 family hydrophobic/amphiphilic exporter-1